MVSSIALTLACGFGTTVWLILAHVGRDGHGIRSLFYTLLAIAYATSGTLLAFRAAGRPLFPAPLIVSLILATIIAVPPGIALAEWRSIRRVVAQENGDDIE